MSSDSLKIPADDENTNPWVKRVSSYDASHFSFESGQIVIVKATALKRSHQAIT